MNKIDMKNYGLNERFINEAGLYEGLVVGRIISQFKDLYKTVTEDGEVMAQVSGKFRYNAAGISDFPAVGDFVMLDKKDMEGNSIIHHVLTRKSAFIRKASGTANDEQIVAANIDIVFICMSLNNDFNLRRLERYIGIGWDSGAVPVVVLTKADLCKNLDERLSELDGVCLGLDVIVTTSMSEDGYLSVTKYIENGKTVAFIGSSGVGKTTLINKLLGDDVYETKGLRNDDKGRHTTTRRELVMVPGRGVVIDTPGMRELGIESADLEKTFSDIDALSQDCRFRDCTHTNEPGCAVKNAIENGSLSEERLLSYLKLKKEAGYGGLNSRQIETKKINEMFKSVGGMKNARKIIKEKNKNK
nr:ribosome small subunit-dependent GTPase A [Sedimentibacter sp.]